VYRILSNQNGWPAELIWTVISCNPSTRSWSSQRTQLFSGNSNGFVAPMLTLSMKHSQKGSKIPAAVLASVVVPKTVTEVPMIQDN
jgi:hypothetical protein